MSSHHTSHVPKKALGQNFLVNEGIIKKIVECTPIEGKVCMEIWPGQWAITSKILEKYPQSLTLIELDGDMIDVLEDRNLWADIDIKNMDVLEYQPDFQKYSVIANIPYYITSPILRHFLYEVKNRPQEMLILMQQDVWDKILWKGNFFNR